VHRLSSIIVWIAATAVTAPTAAAAVTCGEEHFVAGERILPTHDEALTQCREEEVAMTDPTSGQYEKERSCYDVTPPGNHGEWQHGRIAVDVVERQSGDAYTFEALWMCKPVRD
jgi:hypothetical protein